jgi:hypothetical protein
MMMMQVAAGILIAAVIVLVIGVGASFLPPNTQEDPVANAGGCLLVLVGLGAGGAVIYTAFHGFN